MKRGSQWTWGCPCLPVVPSGCVFWNRSTYQLHVSVQPTHQGLQECRRCEDVSLSATSDRCLLLIILGEVTMCLLLSDWGESNVLNLQTGIALRLCNHSLFHPPGWWCLDACRVYLQNVNLPAVLTHWSPLIMCGISLGVLVMFNVKLINSTNKPNKQLSLVEQQQLFGVGREDLVFLYCSGGSIHTLSFAGYQWMHASYFCKYG